MRDKFLVAGLALAMASAPAFAQAAPAPAGPGVLTQIMFFLLIRPQQQRAKKHTEMVNAIKRGDTVVTSGGLIGKVNKVNDTEISLDLAENVRVRVIKSMVIEVRNKAEPVPAND